MLQGRIDKSSAYGMESLQAPFFWGIDLQFVHQGGHEVSEELVRDSL